MRKKVLWWCIWGMGSVMWLIVIIQVVAATNETVVIHSDDSNTLVNTQMQESGEAESTSVNETDLEDSVSHMKNKKPESALRDSAVKNRSVIMRDACININTATVGELVSLQGIGPVLAERIVTFRKENGSFKDESDLVKVKGIGEGKLKKMSNHICF